MLNIVTIWFGIKSVVERFKYSVVDLPCCVIVASEDYYTFFVARVPRR